MVHIKQTKNPKLQTEIVLKQNNIKTFVISINFINCNDSCRASTIWPFVIISLKTGLQMFVCNIGVRSVSLPWLSPDLQSTNQTFSLRATTTTATATTTTTATATTTVTFTATTRTITTARVGPTSVARNTRPIRRQRQVQ